jgi:hypothetical protein
MLTRLLLSRHIAAERVAAFCTLLYQPKCPPLVTRKELEMMFHELLGSPTCGTESPAERTAAPLEPTLKRRAPLSPSQIKSPDPWDEGAFIPKHVPEVFQLEDVVPDGSIRKSGLVVDAVPPEKNPPLRVNTGVLAEPAVLIKTFPVDTMSVSKGRGIINQ